MTSIIYVSSATTPFTNRELAALLSQSREKNARDGITGMLLYKDGTFMQVLEGPPAAIRKQMLSLSRDYRHDGLNTLLDQNVESRQFSEWPMAFWNLNTIDPAAVPGYADFENTPLTSPDFQSDPSRAQTLLLTLRDGL